MGLFSPRAAYDRGGCSCNVSERRGLPGVVFGVVIYVEVGFLMLLITVVGAVDEDARLFF